MCASQGVLLHAAAPPSDRTNVTSAAISPARGLLNPAETDMPRGSSPKRERQYEHIKESYEKRGQKGRAEEIAARTVNKERAEEGETKGSSSKRKSSSSRPSASKKSSSSSRTSAS